MLCKKGMEIKVKKRIGMLLLTVLICMATNITVLADELSGGSDWLVEFNAKKEMVSNFSTANFDDVLDYMQPGDSASFQVEIKNSYETATDWYMTNKVLKSLEDASKTASGGAYSYILTYTDPKGKIITLYNSEEVGGESYLKDLEGLHEATSALTDFFYLDTLEKNAVGKVSLYVKLDGETQGNDYQDTLAQLQMNFAVEIAPVSEGHEKTQRYEERYVDKRIIITEEDQYVINDENVATTNNIPVLTVKTGDDTMVLPLVITAGILGLLLVVVGVAGIRLRKQIKRGR